MRAKNVGAAAAKGRRALLHDQVGFLLVNGVRKRVSLEGKLFRYRVGEIGPVGGTAAGKNELPEAAVFVSVRLGDRLHDVRSAGHVDVPHAVDIEHAGSLRVDDKGEMHHREKPRLLEEVVETAAGLFNSKIHAHKTDGLPSFWRDHVDTDYGEVAKQRQEAQSEIAGDARDDDGGFRLSHGWGWLKS